MLKRYSRSPLFPEREISYMIAFLSSVKEEAVRMIHPSMSIKSNNLVRPWLQPHHVDAIL